MWIIAVAGGETADLPSEADPMHLARDYIHPYKDAGGRPAHCRVRIYLPEDMRDAPVLICSEVPNNPGESITNSSEAIAAAVIRANELPTPLVWVEHWPKERTDGGEEVFELVVFSNYEVIERAPYLGETGVWIDEPTWKSLDRTTVEVLVGGKIQGKRFGWLGLHSTETLSSDTMERLRFPAALIYGANTEQMTTKDGWGCTGRG